MENLSTTAERFTKARGAERSDHKLLDIDVVIRMGSAIQNVHHRRRQHPCAWPAEVTIERELAHGCRGFCGSK
jgi:hypothetical protein